MRGNITREQKKEAECKQRYCQRYVKSHERMNAIAKMQQETGKLQSITKYKFDIDFKFLKQGEITATPINPQLKQLFMKNFEEVDRYE